MRYAFINTLINQAKKNKEIMLLTGDLGFTVFEEFRKLFPNRFINVGVAEQNMMGIATGLALSGKIVFAYSIATFATMRPYEQIRTDIASHNASVIVVGTGAGLSYGDDSITHHSMEDIALMRGIPGMTVVCPADPTEVSWVTKELIKRRSPAYLRLGKKGEPSIYPNTPKLKLGKGSILRKGKHIALIATGNIVENAIKAADIIAGKNINATVISLHTIKPFDEKLIKSLAKNHLIIVTVEEHSIIGGLGSAIAETLSEEFTKIKLVKLGIPDRFLFEIGSQNYLRKRIGLTPEAIARTIINNSI